MKKFWQLAAAATLAISMLAACGDEKEPQQQEQNLAVEESQDVAFPVTVTDARGNEITLEEEPDRIVSLTPSNTEILFELGLDEEIVGVNDNDNYPEQVAEKTRIGGMEYNLELITSLAPDIVFAHESSLYAEGIFNQLEAAGLKVFVVDNAQTFEETYETIETIGTLTNRKEEADTIIENIETKLAKIQAKLVNVEPRKAFIMISASPDIYTVGQNTFMNEMLKVINVENVVQQEGWPMYSAEDFLAANPDTILFTYAGDDETIRNNPAFSDMNAVKNNAMAIVDGDTTSRQGPRIAEGVESLAKAIYPEVFND